MDSKDNFPERIDYVINKLNGPSELSRQTGVTLSTIARWRKGEAEPSRPNLVKIAEAADVSIHWLATGENEPFIAPKSKNAGKVADIGVTMIAGYASVNVSAGFGSFNEDVTAPDCEEPYADNLLAQLNIVPSQCAVFWG